MSGKLSVEDLEVKGKRVLVRVDFNVPQSASGAITDDTRIREALPTLKLLLGRGARVILVTHLGRPKAKPEDKLRLDPVAKRLGELLGRPVEKLNEIVGPAVRARVDALAAGSALMLENVRFDPGEEKNDPAFAQALASLAEVYVNDAFGTAHRAHASTVGVTKFLSPCAAGLLLRKELLYLDGAVNNPERPFTAILGGAKVSTKINVTRRLAEKVDNILIGGGMAYTFLRAMNMEVGNSLVDLERVKDAKEILKLFIDKNIKFLLPFDHLIADRIDPDAPSLLVIREVIPPDMMAVDIGPNTAQMFTNVIKKSKTVIWNGPMGVFEIEAFAKGTYAIARALAESSAVTIIGGGDSVAAINKLGIADKFTHISTGGGASLEMLEGVTLPGIAALTDAR